MALKLSCKISILLFLTGMSLTGQNWNVFNRNFRYNYKYNNSQLVSQVIFVDSVKSSGGDSLYYLNRIGVEINGSIASNMPQFLQRSIKKYNNGIVMLVDTAKLVIHPACQLNQSWLFDSINNKTANCVSVMNQNNFGINDSVKTIIIGGTDTLKLSKHFGILQFAELYNKNKYYRLAGIENAATYDSVPIFGERVPNAWDIYNFDPGDKFCVNKYDFHKPWYTCSDENVTIVNKMLLNGGYSYQVNGIRDDCPNMQSQFQTNLGLISYTSSTYQNLSSPSYLANKMYPGQIISDGANFGAQGVILFNIVRFGLDSQGKFYKYAGNGCNSFATVTFPFNANNTQNCLRCFGNETLSHIYGVGLGQVVYKIVKGYLLALDEMNACVTYVSKKGNLYFGTETFVGIEEQQIRSGNFKFYPNPASDKIHISIGITAANELKIMSAMGEQVLDLKQDLNGQELDVELDGWAGGIYFVQLFQNGIRLKTEKMIRN